MDWAKCLTDLNSIRAQVDIQYLICICNIIQIYWFVSWILKYWNELFWSLLLNSLNYSDSELQIIIPIVLYICIIFQSLYKYIFYPYFSCYMGDCDDLSEARKSSICPARDVVIRDNTSDILPFICRLHRTLWIISMGIFHWLDFDDLNNEMILVSETDIMIRHI